MIPELRYIDVVDLDNVNELVERFKPFILESIANKDYAALRTAGEKLQKITSEVSKRARNGEFTEEEFEALQTKNSLVASLLWEGIDIPDDWPIKSKRALPIEEDYELGE